MEFKLLGRVRAYAAGTERDLLADLRPQHRLLLAILLLTQGRLVTMDMLADWTWDGTFPSADPRGALHGLKSKLSQTFKAAEPGRPDRLPRGANGYRIRVEPDEVDALRFGARVVEVKAHVGHDDDEVVRLGRLALREWGPSPQGLRGQEPLADLRGGWAGDRRGHLHSQHRSVLIHVLDAELRRGHHQQLTAELAALEAEGVSLLDEGFARIFLLSYYRSGLHGEAADFYRRFSQTATRREIKISPELVALAERVRRRDRALDLTGGQAGPPNGEGMSPDEPRPVIPGTVPGSPGTISEETIALSRKGLAVTDQQQAKQDDPDRDEDPREAGKPDAGAGEAQSGKIADLIQNIGVVIAPNGRFGINH